MGYGIRVNNCWGASFYFSGSIFPPTQIQVDFGFPVQFLSSFSVSNFIETLSDLDKTSSTETSASSSFVPAVVGDRKQGTEQQDPRTLISIRSDIKTSLRQLVE